MNIYVGNLGYDVNESELREVFEQYGKVTEVRLIIDKVTGKTKGFGFIEMPEKEEAQKAMAEMNETEFKGRVIKVNEAKPKIERRSGERRGGGGGYRGRHSGGGGKRSGGGGGYSGGGGRKGGGGGYSGNRGNNNRGR